MAYQLEQLRLVSLFVPVLFWLVAKRLAIDKNDGIIWDKADVGAAILAALLAYSLELPIVLANYSLTVSQPYTWLFAAYRPVHWLLFMLLAFIVTSAAWEVETDWPIPRELPPLSQRYGNNRRCD